MAETYVTLSSLKHYDEKIKEVIAEKQDQLVGTEGQVVSFDADGNVISKDLEQVEIDTSNFVEKEKGKGLFSGSYNDLTDKPEIPSVDGFVLEETLNETLTDYAKKSDLPDEYDDTELKNRVTETESAITTLNGTGTGSVTKTVNDALNDFATKVSNDNVVNTYKELVDYAAEHSSDITEIAGDIADNTSAISDLDTRLETIETNLGGHTVGINVPSDAKFTDTVTTVTTSGNGNAVTSVSASNGKVTVTKGSTFLTEHPNITISTDTTSTATATHGGTVTMVDSITRDENGHVTKVNTKTVTLPSDNNTTYNVATSSTNGLMSSTDKAKLDGIATGANKTTVDSALSSTSTNPVQNKVVNTALSGKVPTTRTVNGKALSSDITLSASDIGAAESGHTHKYAGSSSTGGSATSAEKLSTTYMGSATNPVYFKDGVPAATTYTLMASVPSNAKFTDTVYTHPTTSGNKHIPSGGSSGQILRWSADGTAVWGNDSNSTYSAFKGATSSTAGGTGLVPAPTTSNVSQYLKGDGTWGTPTNTTYSNFVKSGSGAKAGLVPAPSTTAGTTKYLREDGTWATPPDTNTTYTLSSFGVTATADELNKLDGVTATTTELNYVDGVTSNIQTQLDGKAASSHGTHVSYSTTAPVVAGTASVGSASTVSRSDHVHPAQTTVSGNAGSATK